jgi:ribulose-5-phosphate 4-epimerase/fuculose-1-phosphate aldolase
LSSEADLHHGILKRFPKINCTLHGNTHYSPLIVSQGIEPVGVIVSAEEFKIKKSAVVPKEYPMFSEQEKEFVYKAFSEMDARGEALTVIMHDHGSFVAAEDHNKAFVLFNALEANSKYIYDRELLKTSKLVSSIFSKISGTGMPYTQNDSEVLNPDLKDKIITANDIEYLYRQNPSKKVIIGSNCILTSMAESLAKELGIVFIRE